MSYLLKYSSWKKLFEQETETAKPTKNILKLSDALGIEDADKSEFDDLENVLYNALLQKINEDTGEKKNLIGKIADENTKKGIIESFIYSKNTPKKFFKKPEEFRFSVDGVTSSANDNHPFFSIKTPDAIPYVNTAGASVIAKSLQEILNDINLKNSDLFATGEDIQYYITVESFKEGKTTIKKFVAKQTTATNKLFTVLEGKVPVFSTAKSSKPGTTTTVTKQATGPKVIQIEIPLEVKDGSPNTTFVVGKADVANPEKTIDIVSNAIQAALEKQGLTGLSNVKLTSIKIISSASNQWGGPVTATHANDGTPTGKAYNEPHPSRTDANYAKSAQSNYDLAKNRGQALPTTIIPGLQAKGITEIASPTFDTRITDTGGNNDTASSDGKKPGRDVNTYPNPGQYAKIIISAETIKEEDVPGLPGEQIQKNQLTQFSLNLLEASGGGGLGFERVRSWFMDRPKYLKKGGGWKSPGYIKRHGGGNRPTNGLAPWFNNLFYSATKF